MPLIKKDSKIKDYEMSNSELFDKEKILFEFGDFWEIFESFYSDFKGSYKELLNEIDQSIKSRNAEDLHIKAHTLKGILGNFYAQSLWDLALKLETKGEDKNLDGADAIFLELSGKIETLLLQVEGFLKEKSSKAA